MSNIGNGFSVDSSVNTRRVEIYLPGGTSVTDVTSVEKNSWRNAFLVRISLPPVLAQIRVNRNVSPGQVGTTIRTVPI